MIDEEDSDSFSTQLSQDMVVGYYSDQLLTITELNLPPEITNPIRILSQQMNVATRDNAESLLAAFINHFRYHIDFVANNIIEQMLEMWETASNAPLDLYDYDDRADLPPIFHIISTDSSDDDSQDNNTVTVNPHYHLDTPTQTVLYFTDFVYDNPIEDIFKKNPFANIDNQESFESSIFDFGNYD